MAVSQNAPKKGEKVRESVLGLRESAVSLPGAGAAGHGLGEAGRVCIPLDGRGARAAEALGDRGEESRRAIAPKRQIAELDER